MTPENKNKLLQLLRQHKEIGISNQIDCDKFHLYSIITHSTAIEGSTVTEVEAQLLFDEGITAKGKPMKEQLMNLDLKNAYGMESQLNDFRSKCRDENLEAVNTGVYNYRLGTFYNDFIAECERIGDYVINVVQAENEARQPVE